MAKHVEFQPPTLIDSGESLRRLGNTHRMTLWRLKRDGILRPIRGAGNKDWFVETEVDAVVVTRRKYRKKDKREAQLTESLSS